MKSVIRTWLEPELIVPDIIDAVFYEESLDQLYVCYNDASYVNVYSEYGSFRWAVSATYGDAVSPGCDPIFPEII